MHLQEDVPLAPYTTINIGGPAQYFYAWGGDGEELRDVLRGVRRNGDPLFILAGGSNVLFPDEGYPGLVVYLDGGSVAITEDVVVADAGTAMQTVVDATIERGLQGLEWAGGLPGSVGGAVRGNAGAFGGAMKDSVQWVEALSLQDWAVRRFTNDACEFAYRESIFKNNTDWCIVRACLQLQEHGDSEALRAEADSHVRYRKERHPQEPNAGSMFKNIVVGDPDDLPAPLRDVESVKQYGKLAAGYVIEQCGLKGERVGGAQISPKHANHVVNRGNATAADVITLLEQAEAAVRDRFGIALEREVHVVTPEA